MDRKDGETVQVHRRGTEAERTTKKANTAAASVVPEPLFPP